MAKPKQPKQPEKPKQVASTTKPIQVSDLTPDQQLGLKEHIHNERNNFPANARAEAEGLRRQSKYALGDIPDTVTDPDRITKAAEVRSQIDAKDKAEAFLEHHGVPGAKGIIEKEHKDALKAEATSRGRVAKAKRVDQNADIAEQGEPYSEQTSVNRRVALVYDAARKHMMMPGEVGAAGGGWYVDSAEQASPTIRLGYPADRALGASGALSQGTKPEVERAAAYGLGSAIKHGQINVTPDVVKHVKGEIPAHLHGQTVGAHQLSPEVFSKIVKTDDPAVRAATTGVDHKAIAGAASLDNVIKATRIFQGEVEQDPRSSPKIVSYGKTHAQALDEHGNVDHAVTGEYGLRAAHIGATIRGEVHGGQGMLDLYGKRDSNEGLLSNENDTAEDSWMNAISQGVPDDKIMKGAGDVPIGAKTHNGQSLHEDPAVTKEALVHAQNNKETSMAAKQIQGDLGLHFTVPSTFVQETAWTGMRRHAGADAQFNAHRRSQGLSTDLGGSPVQREHRAAMAEGRAPRLDPSAVLADVRKSETAKREQPSEPAVAAPKKKRSKKESGEGTQLSLF